VNLICSVHSITASASASSLWSTPLTCSSLTPAIVRPLKPKAITGF
jgi:hypothetical protein